MVTKGKSIEKPSSNESKLCVLRKMNKGNSISKNNKKKKKKENMNMRPHLIQSKR